MKRPVVLAVGAAALVTSVALAWIDVGRERAYRRLLVQGETSLASGDHARAIETFSGALALRPDSMLAYLRRGDAYLRQRQLPEAQRDLLAASRLDPTAPQPHALLGDLALASALPADAAGHYRRVIAIDDRNAHAFYTLALALYEAGDRRAALEPLAKALTLDAGLPEAHLLRGEIARDEGRYADAIAALSKAVTLASTFAPAREALALAYDAAGQQRASLEHLEALAVLDGTTPYALIRLAAARVRAGQVDAALQALERAHALFPASSDVQLARAHAWLESGSSSGAAAQARAVLAPLAAGDSPSSAVLATYGLALLRTGQVTEAEAVLRRAVARFPVAPAAFRSLAEAARRRGHLAEATAAARQYAQLAGSDGR